MRIKKTSQYMEGGAALSNTYGTSQEDGYSQEYINGISEKGYGTSTMYRSSALKIVSGEESTISSLNITTHGRPLMIFVSINARVGGSSTGSGKLYVDGVLKQSIVNFGGSQTDYNDMTIVTGVPAGQHKFQLKIKADNDTGTITLYPWYINSFTIIEL